MCFELEEHLASVNELQTGHCKAGFSDPWHCIKPNDAAPRIKHELDDA